MSNNAKIITARITEQPQSIFDPMPEVWIKLEGSDTEQLLFSYYPDEISFSTKEFIGLTIEEAKKLKGKKDRVYLQS